MKTAKGVIWEYENSPERGRTWAAELKTDNALICVFGQKQMKSAITAANKLSRKLGWRMKEPWSKEAPKD